MRYSILARVNVCLGFVFLLTNCGDSSEPNDAQSATGGEASVSGGGPGTGGSGSGTAATGGTSSGVGGNTSTGGVTSSGGSGAATTTGGTATGGTLGNTGGTSVTTGGTMSTGGTITTGGQSTTGGTSTGGSSTGGTQDATGGTSTGGAQDATGGTQDVTGGTAGTATGGDAGTTSTGGQPEDLDENNKPIAAKGDTTDVPQDYLRLGEIRILNNNWGSEDLGCSSSTMSVFVNDSGSFGWNFNRGDCADNGNPPLVAPDTSHPDFPQVEFGIHPFGIGSEDATSPEFSSTTLLPLQLKDITSASVTLENLQISLGQATSWNMAMEFWLSEGDPRQPVGSVSVHTELMAWWGWNTNRWECDELITEGPVSAGQSYKLCHQDDAWAGGRWRYYQFRAGNGDNGSSSTSFNGTVDVKAFIDYLMTKNGYHGDLWLTRMEVGTEIDDMTNGTLTSSGITFEVNGETRSDVSL